MADGTWRAEPARVVLVGAHGHGHWHFTNLRRLGAAGVARLVGVCDVRPVESEKLEGFDDPEQSDDLGALVDRTHADIAIIVTPIHTHAALLRTALEHGAHVLLEKPPAATLREFAGMHDQQARSGLSCQVGFQSLGSESVAAVRAMVEAGEIGTLRGIGVAGAWPRGPRYFQRAAWSGKRRIGSGASTVDVVDGALTNPFAHAVATALAVDGSEEIDSVDDIALEMYRANEIESDDTSAMRLRTAKGTVITVAVSLCAPYREEPYLLLHGDSGRIRFCYTKDEVILHRRDGSEVTHRYSRTDLLENLVDHMWHGADLLVPLARTGAFMRVLDAVRTAPDPVVIPDAEQEWHADEDTTRRVLPGIHDIVEQSARRLALFSELDVSWARRP